ncbi:MAG: hypothetical protein RLN62_04020 [Rickettsiales bacterium]
MTLSQKFHLQGEVSESEKKKVSKAFDDLFGEANPEDLVFASESEDELREIVELSNKLSSEFDSIIFVGTGASYTIPKMYLDFAASHKTNFYYLRNFDVQQLNAITTKLDPKKTAAILISKSGQTAEVVVNFLKLHEWIKKHVDEDEIKNHFITITEESPTELFTIAETLGCTNFVHPHVGGRFAVFTVVGLLAASLGGFNIIKLMSSVKKVTDKLIKEKKSLIDSAVFYYANYHEHKHHGMLSYGECFDGFNEWHSQLVFESLGKNNSGVASITSIGAYDQHIKLQYLLDGSKDLFCTLIHVKKFNQDLKIKNHTKIKALNYYQKNTVNEVLNKNKNVVLELLKQSNKSIREVTLNNINEEDIAGLIVRQILELMLLGFLNGINPFGQPAVQNIKSQIEDELKHG